ncbi:hypothetical protein [Methanolobus sp. WCC4]|uniref:hypothetical protein n=1 Tax=Methanolobus sp. WCC4 TaxID=3125784 RepID=UPI0030F803E8
MTSKFNPVMVGFLLVALFMLLTSTEFTMLTGDQSVELPAGETVQIPYKYTYDDYWEPYIPEDTSARIAIDWDGSQRDRDDKYLTPFSISADETVEGTFPLTVYGDVGEQYEVEITMEVKEADGRYDSIRDSPNTFELSITVIDPADYDEPDDSESPVDEIDFNAAVLTGSAVISLVLVLLVGIVLARRKKE